MEVRRASSKSTTFGDRLLAWLLRPMRGSSLTPVPLGPAKLARRTSMINRAPPPFVDAPRGSSRYSRRLAGGFMPTQVPAHITGTVWKIEKSIGDNVAVGEVVVILESMKMEMPVEAPAAGRVREIRAAEGQSVQEGDILLVLE
jgi:acetyl-CoA carboxylase biotin carboxyl carrier protein